MKAILTALLAFSAFALHAQVNDSLDNIVMKIPATWQVTRNNTYTELMLFDKKQNNFCQVAVYQQQPASGDKVTSFRKEWDETVRTYFEAPANVTPVAKKIRNGVTTMSYGSQVTATCFSVQCVCAV